MIITGNGIAYFRMLAIKGAFELEGKGIRMSRGVSVLKIVKGITGLKTNKRDVQMAELLKHVEAAKLNVQPGDIEQ